MKENLLNDQFTILSMACGLKPSGSEDLLLILMPPRTTVAGVFTTSQITSPSVDWCRSILPDHSARALIVHSGNANACTGAIGFSFVQRLTRYLADHLQCSIEEIYVASTGIVGRYVPENLVFNGLHALLNSGVHRSFEDAAKTIMTTDTVKKISFRHFMIGNQKVEIIGIAKGSGMIMPNMATMLAFIFTNFSIPADYLQQMLEDINQQTFSCITVDGDTSTNDTFLTFSTQSIQPTCAEDFLKFRQAFFEVTRELSLAVVKDGEGISKLISVTVQGAWNNEEAHAVAMSICNSPLVKTAMAGQDPNWGRIAMAVGKTKEARIDSHALIIKIADITLMQNGSAANLSETLQEKLLKAMKEYEINIEVTLGSGSGKSTIHTCDLTHEYIRINGEYTT